MPAKLIDYWTAKRLDISGALAHGRISLASAAAAELAQGSKLSEAVKAGQAAQGAFEAARTDLAGIPMPADGHPLLAAMQLALAQLREAQAAQVKAEAGIRAAQAERTSAQAQVAALGAQLSEVDAEVARATTADAQRLVWDGALRAGPLRDLPATAADALTAFEADATKIVEDDFPKNANPAKDFLTVVRARRAFVAAELADRKQLKSAAEQAQKTWLESTTRKADLVPALAAEHARAVAELRRVAESGPLVADAIAVLQRFQARTTGFVSIAEFKGITTVDKTNRENALALLDTLTNSQKAESTARTAYAKALDAARISEPTKSDAQLQAANAPLQALADTYAAKQLDVQNASDALAGAPGNPLRAWFSAVPEPLWQALDALEAALALLKQVRDGDPPADVADAAETAEDELVAALLERDVEALQVAIRTSALRRSEQLEADGRALAASRLRVASRFVLPA